MKSEFRMSELNSTSVIYERNSSYFPLEWLCCDFYLVSGNGVDLMSTILKCFKTFKNMMSMKDKVKCNQRVIW